MRNYLHDGLDGQEKVNYTYKIHVKSPNPINQLQTAKLSLWNKNSMCHIFDSFVFLISDCQNKSQHQQPLVIFSPFL